MWTFCDGGVYNVEMEGRSGGKVRKEDKDGYGWLTRLPLTRWIIRRQNPSSQVTHAHIAPRYLNVINHNEGCDTSIRNVSNIL